MLRAGPPDRVHTPRYRDGADAPPRHNRPDRVAVACFRRCEAHIDTRRHRLTTAKVSSSSRLLVGGRVWVRTSGASTRARNAVEPG
jgi:hypothetical protein